MTKRLPVRNTEQTMTKRLPVTNKNNQSQRRSNEPHLCTYISESEESDGETLYSEEASHDSDFSEHSSDLDFIDDSEAVECIPHIPISRSQACLKGQKILTRKP